MKKLDQLSNESSSTRSSTTLTRSEVEHLLDQQAHDLQERIKELQCLYDVSRILLDNDGPIEAVTLTRIAKRIPAGWQYPDLTEVRIRVGDEVGETPGFRETDWMQRDQRGQGESLAVIEIAYTEDPRAADESLFLGEERRLLESLVERLFEASRRSRAEQIVRFQAGLLDAVGESVIATGLDGLVQHWNRAAEEMYGWTAEEAIGRRVLDLAPSQDLVDASPEIMEAVSNGESWTGECRVGRKDGSQFIAQFTNSAILDEDGTLTGVVGVSRDVTRVKELEASLNQAQRLEALGRLAGGIAHDFNNMLTAIQGNAQLLAMDMDDEYALEGLDEIRLAASRAADLTSQLLAFSRRQMLTPKVIALDEVVADMESMVSRLLSDQLELRFDYAPDAGNVRADPTQLSQIVINLVLNARDAVSQDGRISVSVSNEHIAASHMNGRAIPAGDYVVLSVRDNGEGMDKETRESVFEPFFTTKSEGKGTGLGLATVYGIVKQSEGYIELDSALDEGTTIRVLLPRVFSKADRLFAGEESEGRESNGVQKLLLCEDEPTVRRVTQRSLERQGYEVIAAESGPRALELFDAEEPGTIRLVISDVVMPEMSGLDLRDAIRERAPKTRFLLVSGYAKPELLDGHDTKEEDTFLRKPFDPHELTELVADLLEDAQHD